MFSRNRYATGRSQPGNQRRINDPPIQSVFANGAAISIRNEQILGLESRCKTACQHQADTNGRPFDFHNITFATFAFEKCMRPP